MEIWTHKYVATRNYPSYGPKHQIKVTAGLHKLGGNARAYFSVTAEIFVPRANDCEACGCLHGEVLKFWPKLAPVVALHLSDDNGVPMHAKENGWYWLSGYYGGLGERYHGGNSQPTKTGEECLQIFADHVRVSIEAARALALEWATQDNKVTREFYTEWLTQQYSRWKQEATDAVTLLDTLIEPLE